MNQPLWFAIIIGRHRVANRSDVFSIHLRLTGAWTIFGTCSSNR
jgi:hypothetical protein